jgi:hypothetical protein
MQRDAANQSAEAAYADFGAPLVLKVSIPKSAAATYQALRSRVFVLPL